MAETTAAPETAIVESDVLTPQEESQLHGEPEKTTEKAVKAEPEKKETKEEKVVPYAAMHEERMRRKEIQKEMQALKEKSELAEKRLAELAERFKPKVPEYEENPAAHLKHKVDTLESEVQESREFKKEQERIKAEQKKQEEFVGNYRAYVNVFKKQTPDFDQAYAFIKQSRFEELKAIGYEDNEIANILINEEYMIVSDAFRKELDPAERMYKLAKARGYAKEKSEAEKQIETVQKGLEASKTLSKGGGSSGGLTVQALADMSEEEFAKLDEATLRKLMGG